MEGSAELNIAKIDHVTHLADRVVLTCRAGTLDAITVTIQVMSARCFRMLIAHGTRSVDRRSDIVVSAPEASITARETDRELVVDAGEASLVLAKDPWHLELRGADGAAITESIEEDRMLTRERYAPATGLTAEIDRRGRPWVTRWVPTWTRLSLLLAAEEHVWGCGEKYTRLEKNGQRIDVWNQNARGARSELSYRNVPFYLSNRGYGLYVDNTERTVFDFGTRSVRSLVVEANSGALDLYLIAGASPARILREYAELTGKPEPTPKWALGLWISTGFDRLDRDKVEREVERIRALQIPCDVFHFDCFWLRDGRWSDLTWDETRFPDPPSMLRAIKKRGFRVSVWENTYVSIFSERFEEGRERGYFLKDERGEPIVTNLWLSTQPGMAIIDLTNPEAVEWYLERHRELMAMGVDTFKTDFGEEIPPDARYADGRDGATMHNLYSLLYHRAVFGAVKAKHGAGVIWARSGCAGSKRYPIHWSGDPECTFEDMAATLRAGLSDSLMGHALWSHDIGGFYGEPSKALYVRWAQFGLLSPAARCHSQTPRFPWSFDEQALEIFRSYTRLRYRLIPYLYSYLMDASESGVPIARPMFLEYPDDPTCIPLDLQYVLGRELLVAPVFNEQGDASFYLPAGRWVHLLTREGIDGPAWVRRRVPLDYLPLFVREDSIVPLVEPGSTVDERYPEAIELLASVSNRASFRLRDAHEDVTVEVQRSGGLITFRASERRRWSVRLLGCERPVSVRGEGELREIDPNASASDGFWMEGGAPVIRMSGDSWSARW